jgi:predicted AAA+ superfamily ATPase
MDYHYRHLTDKLLKYSESFPVVVLSGARQTGKSTLLNHLWGKSRETIVFDPVLDIENARSEPELFFKNHPGPLILDEIQYAPELIPVIKRLADREKIMGKYILTGSQQWGVLSSIAESLAGRAVILNLYGYNIPEYAGQQKGNRWIEKFLDTGTLPESPEPAKTTETPLEMIYRGQLPGVRDLPLAVIPDYLDSYTTTYIERDIRVMADITDLKTFGRFFRLCCALSAQEINYSQAGRDIGITPQTARRWLDLLSSSFQWREIPLWSGNTVKKISGKPKGYCTDTGLICRSLYLSSPLALESHPAWGHIFETIVVMDLLKTFSTMDSAPGVWHWRSRNGAKVDLILERDGRIFPIEIKSTARPSRSDTRGISAFRQTCPELKTSPGLVIHAGDTSGYLSDTVYGISWLCL